MVRVCTPDDRAAAIAANLRQRYVLAITAPPADSALANASHMGRQAQ